MEEALLMIDMLAEEFATVVGVVVSSRRDIESHTVRRKDILDL